MRKFNLFGRVIEIRNSSDLPRLSDDRGWQSYLSGRGMPVTASNALQIATVIRCVDVVAKTMASLPLSLMTETNRGKVKAKDHNIYKLLSKMPNPQTTAYEFWHMYIVNLMLTRGAYAKVIRDRNGFIRELWNIPTANVSKYTNSKTGERYIVVTFGQNYSETLYEGQYMYTQGFRFGDSRDPLNPIDLAADTLGLTTALNLFSKEFFQNGSNLGGFIEYPGAMSDDAYVRFKESWEKSYSGVLNQHKVAFLEDGMKFTQTGRDPDKSQALESRKFQILEICRVFGVPPHKVFELERATFSNIEQQNIEYVQDSIDPMAVRLEQTIYKDLLTTAEQRSFYAKFNVNGLLRGDMATRTTFYHNARQDGWMNADEIRGFEDMNNIEDGSGQIYAINGNMIPLNSVPQNLPKGATK